MKAMDKIVLRRTPENGKVSQASSLTDDIAFQLQADILQGVFAPGQHLKQGELCHRYGVSRTPIREALQQLQSQDMLTIIPNKGAVVRTPTAKSLMEVYQIRAELESFAAELAISNWTEEEEIELMAVQAKIAAIYSVASRKENFQQNSEIRFAARIAAVNEDFHAVINSASGNEKLKGLISNLRNSVPSRQSWYAIKNADEAHRLNIADHEDIIDAFRQRNATAARNAVRDHILRAGEMLVETFGHHIVS